MPRNKTRAIEDIDISIALANFWISPLIDQCKLNDIEVSLLSLFLIRPAGLRSADVLQPANVHQIPFWGRHFGGCHCIIKTDKMSIAGHCTDTA